MVLTNLFSTVWTKHYKYVIMPLFSNKHTLATETVPINLHISAGVLVMSTCVFCNSSTSLSSLSYIWCVVIPYHASTNKYALLRLTYTLVKVYNYSQQWVTNIHHSFPWHNLHYSPSPPQFNGFRGTSIMHQPIRLPMCSNTPPPVIMSRPDCPFVALSCRAVLKYIFNDKTDGSENYYGCECCFFFMERCFW